MEIKQSRADITYVPKVKELKDAIYFPTHKEELENYGKILEHYELKALNEGKSLSGDNRQDGTKT